MSARTTLRAVRKGKEAGIRVTAEVTPHHFTLTDDYLANPIAYDTNTKMNPPLREVGDRDSMLAGIADGSIDCIATDHAPHSVADKEIEFDLAAPGLTMLETAFGLCMKLVHDGHLSLPTLVERLTIGPVRAWGLDRRPGLEGIGTLAPGALGDVALQAADEPRVGVGVDEELDVHQRAQRRVRIDQQPFDDDGAARLAAKRGGAAGVAGEVVFGRIDRAPVLQLADVVDEQIGLERVGMVVVERGALLEAEIVAVAIVAVVVEDHHIVGAEALDDAADDGGLAGA